MIILKINEVMYSIASDWTDVTVSQAASLLNLKMPDSLKELYDIQMKPGDLTPEQHDFKISQAEDAMSLVDQYKNIPRYFSRVIETLSNIPAGVLRRVDVNSIKALYHTYVRKFVEGVHYFPADYQYKDIGSFEFDGVKYLLPVDKKIFGQAVPMVDVTALEFSESADLMIYMARLSKDRDFSRVANMVSILCRPEGEQYDEGIALQRAEQFQNLTMDVCWNVFFSLITPLIIANQYVQISFMDGLARERVRTN